MLSLSSPQVLAIADGVSCSTAPHRSSLQLLGLVRGAGAHDLYEKPMDVLRGIEAAFGRQGGEEGFSGGATTLVGICMTAAGVVVFNAGDSRAYLLRNEVMRQISSDHTQLQDMLDAGEITLEQAPALAHMYRGLTSYFVASPTLDDTEIYIRRGPVQIGDTWLLCSDGLTDGLDDQQIVALMDDLPLPIVARQLALAARQRSTDDLSLVLVRCE